jgi:hypothetical protein
MSQIFLSPFVRTTTKAGLIAPGAKLYFYLTGTSTLVNIYADDARTVALTNPVVADAFGSFPSIFLDPDTAYRVRLTSAAGVLLAPEADPVRGIDADAIVSEAIAASVAAVETMGPALMAEFATTIAQYAYARTSGHRIFVEGDSKSVILGGSLSSSALNWALAKYPVDVYYDPAVDNLGVNGSTTGTSATAGTDYYGVTPVPLGVLHPTRLARCYAAIARGCDTAIYRCGVNDVLAADTGAGSTVANIITWCGLMRTAGIKRIILFVIGPVGSGTPTALQAKYTAARNRALHQFAALNADISIVDENGWMVDTSSALFIPKGGATGALGNTTYDGLHENVYGGCGIGQYALGPVLARLFPPRDPAIIHGSDAYDSADGKRGNLYGTIGRFGGSGGLVSFPSSTVTNAGVAAAGWVFGGSVSGLTIDFSVVPCSYLNTKYNRTDFNALRMTFSGTPGGSGFGAMAVYNLTPVDISGYASGGLLLDNRWDITCNALNGVSCFQLYYQPNATGASAYWGNQLSSASDILPQLDGDYHLGMPAPWNLYDTAKTSILAGLAIGYRAGVAMSGSIDFVGATLARHITLP